jgi:hypothetical protein
VLIKIGAKVVNHRRHVAFRGARIAASRPYDQAVLSKRDNSAKIHPGLGFVWRIPANTLRSLPPIFDDRFAAIASNAHAGPRW